jgi:sec-independent protein translocase protein TatB
MFDIGWDEMALIAVVSLIVIGPKDLPVVLRQMGRWTRKAREMAADFQRGIDDMARESELDDLKNQVAKVAQPNLLKAEIDKAIDPDGQMAKAMEMPVLDMKTGMPVSEPEPAPEPVKLDAAPARPPEP